MKEKSLGINIPIVKPSSPTSDLDRISPYTISTISSRQVMRIKKISIRESLVDPIPNSPN